MHFNFAKWIYAIVNKMSEKESFIIYTYKISDVINKQWKKN